MQSPFPGYDLMQLSDVPALWLSVRANLDVPIDAVKQDRKSVAALNWNVNLQVSYFAELPGADDWQLPAHTWSIRKGDCEDIALLKYAVLRKSGFDDSDLMFVIGMVLHGVTSLPHACLLVHVDGEWHVLDSLFSQLIYPMNYRHFAPLKGMSGDSAYLFSRTFTLADALAKNT